MLNIRRDEIKVLSKVAHLNAFSIFIWTCAPYLVSITETIPGWQWVSHKNICASFLLSKDKELEKIMCNYLLICQWHGILFFWLFEGHSSHVCHLRTKWSRGKAWCQQGICHTIFVQHPAVSYFIHSRNDLFYCSGITDKLQSFIV